MSSPFSPPLSDLNDHLTRRYNFFFFLSVSCTLTARFLLSLRDWEQNRTIASGTFKNYRRNGGGGGGRTTETVSGVQFAVVGNHPHHDAGPVNDSDSMPQFAGSGYDSFSEEESAGSRGGGLLSDFGEDLKLAALTRRRRCRDSDADADAEVGGLDDRVVVGKGKEREKPLPPILHLRPRQEQEREKDVEERIAATG